uniref:AB hydrolase-1 domain-containing protein n=1 Tax=Phlebotomus papatasi TaxID=29031 RepID=A0A1B0D0K7_PHLPP
MITRVFCSAKNTFSLAIRRGMASAKAIEDKIQVDDVKINYVKVGSGERAVLLLPGALGSAKTDFGPQIEKLPDILPNFTVIGWDPPGYGKSIPPRRQFPLDFFYKDARYAHKLMENLSFKKYSILGWSDGGITGMIQAAEFPNAVENLAIWGSNAYIAPKEIEIYESRHSGCQQMVREDEEANGRSVWSGRFFQTLGRMDRCPYENLQGKGW